MKTISILLAGSCVVPLVAVAVFAVWYFRRYKQYLLERNSHADCLFLSEAWKGYISTRLALKKHREASRFWWYFFGEKYMDLLNYYSEKCMYELDQLNQFKESDDNRPCFNRKSFMRHWEAIQTMLLNYGSPHKLYPEFGEYPFGWMTVMIESKLFELYRKEALQVLRTKGYIVFNNFLVSWHETSKLYPHNTPFSIIASGKFHEKIAVDNSVEIGERIRHEVKLILGESKTAQTLSDVQKLESLTETFLLKGGLAPGGSYNGTYQPGLSEARHEIFDLLDKAKTEVDVNQELGYSLEEVLKPTVQRYNDWVNQIVEHLCSILKLTVEKAENSRFFEKENQRKCRVWYDERGFIKKISLCGELTTLPPPRAEKIYFPVCDVIFDNRGNINEVRIGYVFNNSDGYRHLEVDNYQNIVYNITVKKLFSMKDKLEQHLCI